MLTSITSFYLGRVSYSPALFLQKAIVQLTKELGTTRTHTILLLEHYPVYTIGVRQTDPANDYSEAGITDLQKLGAEFVKTDRGGLITYHGPGQLVAYPIVNLRCKDLIGKGLRWYVCALEQAGVDVCARFGLKAFVGGASDIGVWLSPTKKIMSVGVHKTDAITYHGVALNCTTEPLSWLRKIVPCGLVGREATCLSEACRHPIELSDVGIKMSDCLVNSLFGKPSNRKSHLLVQYRTDLQGNWDNSTANHSTEFSSHFGSSNPPRIWSDVVNSILQDLRSRTKS
ncbi:unnamed protein product [Calicophoron daubneyi]|uniref:lipoyl(octanoyl) transferase n=1 Tax=Calicophoron daubneyi TaxID=300641 RepID=A0AAV2T7C0_CALDB